MNTAFLGQAGEADPESLPGQSWVEESILVLGSSVPNPAGLGKGFSFACPWVSSLEKWRGQSYRVEDQVRQHSYECALCGVLPAWLQSERGLHGCSQEEVREKGPG